MHHRYFIFSLSAIRHTRSRSPANNNDRHTAGPVREIKICHACALAKAGWRGDLFGSQCRRPLPAERRVPGPLASSQSLCHRAVCSRSRLSCAAART